MFSIGKKKTGAAPAKAPAAARKPRLVSLEVQLTPAQKKKYAQLGGDAWLQEQIDQAEAVNPFSIAD